MQHLGQSQWTQRYVGTLPFEGKQQRDNCLGHGSQGSGSASEKRREQISFKYIYTNKGSVYPPERVYEYLLFG